MNLYSNTFADGAALPQRAALGRPDPDSHVAFADNRSPHLAWQGAPAGTRSFVVLCVDPDCPSVGDDVNQEGREVAADLPRVDFFHWVLVDIPATTGSLAEGAEGAGVTPGGAPAGAGPHGLRGLNDYTHWFADDPEMAGEYGGYDGPCPPWNDARIHRYVFTVLALDVESLGLSGTFGGKEVRQALEGHVLAEASITGHYALSPELRG